MRKWSLSVGEMAARGGANVCVEIDARDIPKWPELGEATENVRLINLFAMVANKTSVELTGVELVVPFVGTAAEINSTALEVVCGASALLDSTELNAAGTEVFVKGGTASAAIVPTTNAAVRASITTPVDTAANSHTAGLVRLYFKVTDARGPAR
jgi:hypothetical protein